MILGIMAAMVQDFHFIPLESGNGLWCVNTGDPALTAHTFFEARPGNVSIFNAEFLVNAVVVNAIRGHATDNCERDIIWIDPAIGGTLIPFRL